MEKLALSSGRPVVRCRVRVSVGYCAIMTCIKGQISSYTEEQECMIDRLAG
jgi:hypothetical protein